MRQPVTTDQIGSDGILLGPNVAGLFDAHSTQILQESFSTILGIKPELLQIEAMSLRQRDT